MILPAGHFPLQRRRALPEFLVFLFPPLPGFEDAPQAGQLTVAADGWRSDPGHQTSRMKRSVLIHHMRIHVVAHAAFSRWRLQLFAVKMSENKHDFTL